MGLEKPFAVARLVEKGSGCCRNGAGRCGMIENVAWSTSRFAGHRTAVTLEDFKINFLVFLSI